jgi:hypothetical protein
VVETRKASPVSRASLAGRFLLICFSGPSRSTKRSRESHSSGLATDRHPLKPINDTNHEQAKPIPRGLPALRCRLYGGIVGAAVSVSGPPLGSSRRFVRNEKGEAKPEPDWFWKLGFSRSGVGAYLLASFAQNLINTSAGSKVRFPGWPGDELWLSDVKPEAQSQDDSQVSLQDHGVSVI